MYVKPMKSAGLSSKTRKAFKHISKTSVFASQQEGHLAAKEKQRLLRMQAAKAQFDRQQKAGEAAKDGADTIPANPA